MKKKSLQIILLALLISLFFAKGSLAEHGLTEHSKGKTKTIDLKECKACKLDHEEICKDECELYGASTPDCPATCFKEKCGSVCATEKKEEISADKGAKVPMPSPTASPTKATPKE